MTQDLQKEVESLRELVKLMNLGSWRTVVLHNPMNSKRPSPESVTAFFPANPDMIRDLLHEIIQTPPTPAKESCGHEWVWEHNDPSWCGKCGAKWQKPNPPEDERGGG